jgi:hypothetical protein
LSLRRNKIKDLTNWPQNNDIYYWVRSDIGDICQSTWVDDVPYHEFRRSIGNVFRTRNEARIAIVRQQALVGDRKVANG